jgi:mono/diheme cytochrome c family protein
MFPFVSTPREAFVWLRLSLAVAAGLMASAGARAAAEGAFHTDVRQFFQRYCIECHSTEKSKGGMDLEVIQRPEDFLEHPTALTHAIEQMEFGDMPPADAPQPKPGELARAMAWLTAELNRQRNAAPDDPGIVVAPRLNSAEYGNAIRHLTGTAVFDASAFVPSEGGAGEGFANVGEAQSMVVSQFETYLSAANRVLSHARLTPQTGVTWFATPQAEAGTGEELIKSLLQNWSDWYARGLNDLAETHLERLRSGTGMTWGAYVERLWQFKNASALKLPWRSLDEAASAAEPRLFPEVLRRYEELLTTAGGDKETREMRANRFFPRMLERYRALKPAELARDRERRAAFQAFEKDYERYIESGRWSREESKLEDAPGADLAKNERSRTWEGGRAIFPLDLTRASTGEVVITLADCGDGAEPDHVVLGSGVFVMADGSKKPWQTVLPGGLLRSGGGPIAWASDDPTARSKRAADEIGVKAPAVLRFRIPAGAKRLSFEARLHPDFKESSVMPAVDDRPVELVEGRVLGGRVLGAAQSKRARAFASEFGKLAPATTALARFVRVNPRSAFADLDWLDAGSAARLGIQWPQRGEVGAGFFLISTATVRAQADAAQRAQIEAIGAQLRELSRTGDPAAERAAAASLIADFAARAWRRKPSPEELAGLGRLYTADREAGLNFEFAVKTALKAVLVSPEFLYRFQTAKNSTDPYLIADADIADRLAFFLWAGPPDAELIALASRGRLNEPATLAAQARRMLAEPRSRALATEFAGQWLHFNGFESFTGPDAGAFPEFTPSLRRAMYQEAVEYLHDLIKNNRPLTHLIKSDYTFANEELARFYGLSEPVKGPEMRRVSTAGSPRGGILTMASVLTKHSAPLRTSQVQRGVWIYEQILGVRLPAPPPDVPQLSDTETDAAGLTIARQLERHRSVASCAACHAKFDALGFALENFDPIGRWRTTDTAGNPVENREKLGSGEVVDGLDGLRGHLMKRLDEVIATYCRKLAGFALGRGLLVTDEPLINRMVAAVKADGNRPDAALTTLLASRQFRYRRDEAAPAAATATSAPDAPAYVRHD